ncbi:hypothetical protein ACIHFE_25070 [Streptomyces sp. NPDC052396]|uniref:hypothetical protein n=1 Tax=Streptomyces sp. NPDC052396 TaxID=3365689 RepID=UPI0037CE98AE
MRDRTVLAAASARGGLDGAEAVLELRALIDNGDLDACWAYCPEREHHRRHPTPGRHRYQLTD